MDFSYSESHGDIKNLASEILGDHADPERLKKLEANGPYFDAELWHKLVESGIHSASFPTALGGMGMDYNATTLVAEVIGQTVVSIPYIPCIISTAMPLINSALNNKAVLNKLQGITSGEQLITTAFIEPGNEAPLDPRTEASPQGDSWVVNGNKHCVPYAADASSLMVTAVNNGQLWVGLVDTQQNGVSCVAQRCTANEPQYQVSLNQATATCVAEGDAAHALIEQSVAMTSAAYCAMAVGCADKMTRISGEYTSQREQFGVAIATFQAVAHRLADCYIDNECLKIITLKATSDVNNGDYSNDSILMAKAWCGDVLHRVSHAAQHVHGGMGIDRDYHLFRYCLWAKQLELTLGNSKQQIAALADRIEARYLTA